MTMRINCVWLGGLLLGNGGLSAFQIPTRPIGHYGRAAVGRQYHVHHPLAAMVDIDESVNRDVLAMDEWATNCGVQKADGVQLTTEDGMDFSLVTSQDLAAGTPALFVPAELILSANAVRQEFGSSLAAAEEQMVLADAEDMIPRFALFIKVLAEYERGDESPYFPWLNSLPRQFYNGASMTFACYESLLPYVSRLSMDERCSFINFQRALRCVDLSEQTLKNSNLAKWAYNVVITRSYVTPDGDKKIAPMADMLNHGTETEVDIQYDEEGNCMVYAAQDLPAGSPLRMSYGDPTNPSPLFAKYGFFDKDSPSTFCKLMTVEQEMEDLGLDYSKLLFYDTGEISDEVWDVLLYQLLAVDTNLQQGFYQACMNGDAETKGSYHQEYYANTLDALRNHVDGTLADLEKLTAAAYTKDPATHPRIPVILSHNDFVKNTFLRVKARLDSM